MKKKERYAVMLLGLTAAFVFSFCGGGDDDDDSSFQAADSLEQAYENSCEKAEECYEDDDSFSESDLSDCYEICSYSMAEDEEDYGDDCIKEKYEDCDDACRQRQGVFPLKRPSIPPSPPCRR